jgi:hypothetical protein
LVGSKDLLLEVFSEKAASYVAIASSTTSAFVLHILSKLAALATISSTLINNIASNHFLAPMDLHSPSTFIL